MASGGRSLAQRALMSLCALLAVGGGLSATTVAYGAYRLGNIPTEDLDDVLAPTGPATPPPPPEVDPSGGAGQVAEPDEPDDDEPGAPFNVLLVGDSSRDFVETEEDLASFGGADEARLSDSILLIRVDPAAGTAATVPFPRDLYVELADDSGRQRINKAYERGGARLLIETITSRFDVPINHYVRLDFEGFRGLVDAVGGVTLAIEHPARDFNVATGRNESGLSIPRAGCVTLAGDQALAYVRSRHFQERIDGRWVPDGRNDFGRSERQQQFVRQVLAKALSEGLLNPRTVLDLLDVADQSLRLSAELDAQALANLVRDARRLSTDSFTHYSLPVVDLVTPAGAQVLRLDRAAAEPIFEVFRGLAPPAIDEDEPAPAIDPGPTGEQPEPAITTTTVAPAPLC